MDKNGPKRWFVRLQATMSMLNANRKRFFWYWVSYQAIKGLITLSFIWIPVLLIWLHGRTGT